MKAWTNVDGGGLKQGSQI
jgi:hypothetical protein